MLYFTELQLKPIDDNCENFKLTIGFGSGDGPDKHQHLVTTETGRIGSIESLNRNLSILYDTFLNYHLDCEDCRKNRSTP
jgi:hypothetical protein